MKRLSLTFAGVAVVCTLAFGLSSCMTDGGVGVGVAVGPGYEYGYGDGAWAYGHDWYHHGHDDRDGGWAHVHPRR